MGLPGRRHPPALLWEPDCDGVLLRDACEVEDTACPSGYVYMVRFTAAGVPESVVFVWVYPARRPDGNYTATWRWMHWRPGPGCEALTRTGRGRSVCTDGDLRDATAEARSIAEGLAGTGHPGTGRDDLDGIFAWDGRPW